MNHTPGPWGIGRSADGTPGITVPVHPSEGTGFCVAAVNRLPKLGSVRGDMDANARLIAAAPDLLTALEDLIGDCKRLASPLHHMPLSLPKAQAAVRLAKAEGKP